MAQSITLSAPIRSNLLTLQNTSSLINRTENRLSTGLKVASAIDDAVAYFQAKALSDRATDFSEKKDGIDQGISQLTTAVNAIDSVEAIVKQMKGLVMSAKSSTDAERADLMAQFATLSENVSHLSNDATYQGLNLVNATTSILKVDFSNASNSYIEVTGRNIQASVLFTAALGAATAVGQALVGAAWSTISNSVSKFDNATSEIDKALTTLKSAAKSLGSNVALLQTRLDFTKTYANTLDEGSGKLTLADLNEEGANLVALQTRQQLGIQALQFSGQSEQAVLQLFR